MRYYIKHLCFSSIVFIFIVILSQFNFDPIYSNDNNKDDDYNERKYIEICCTWGDKLVDEILTYQINNAKPETKNLVVAALNYWEKNTDGIKFKEADSKEQVDIKISFRNDNGKVAGQTMTNFDSDGFIFSTKVVLAEKAFGKQLNKNVIEYIAKHELGHALGLGHANFNESLMSALVYHSFNKITDCERGALIEANKWKLRDNNSFPTMSENRKYFC